MNGHRLVILAAGSVLLAVVAVPERRPGDVGRPLPRLDAAPRLAGFLARVPAGEPGGERLSAWATAMRRDPAGGASLLEARLAGLRFGGEQIAPRLDAALRLLWPSRALSPPGDDGRARDRPLPLRAPGLLGARGLAVLSASAENWAAFPEDVRSALSRLAAAVDAAAAAAADPEAAALALRGLAAVVDLALPVLHRAAARGDFRRLLPLPDGGGLPRGLLLLTEIDAGLVVVGGGGPTVLPMRGVALAVDVGGDDRWLGAAAIGEDPHAAAAAPAARLVLDLAGRDRYVGDGETFASAAGGVSMLVDAAGDDRYEAEARAFASAENGAALLVDRAGRDRYRAAAGGLGWAGDGVALLLDDGGDDRFEVHGPGLGAAEGGGLAVLLDAWGNDVHLALGVLPDPGAAPVVALGAATAGGVGLFADRDGRDVYRAASRAGGFAAGGGVGVFVDAGGDDLLSFGEESLGSARDGGFALFRDLDGDDRVLSRARSQGFADGGFAVHLDDAGDDDRLSRRPSGGAFERGGTAVFADLDGR